MSTQTTFKRVALIAVASLGLGVLTSIAPANAGEIDGGVHFKSSVPTGTVDADDVIQITQTSGANNSVTLVTQDDGAGVLEIKGSTLNIAASVDTAVITESGAKATQTEGTSYRIPTKTAGTITVKYFATNAENVTATTASEIVEITVIDAASLKVSAGNSKSILDVVDEDGDGGTDKEATKDDTVVAVGLGGEGIGAVAHINVTLKNGVGAGTAMPTEPVKAIISGAGLVDGSSVSANETDGAGKFSFEISSDGTAGVGTITITSGKVVIATEKVTFSGAPKTITATQNLKVVENATEGSLGDFGVEDDGTHNGAVTLTVKDKDGNLVPNALEENGDTSYDIVGTSSDKKIIKNMAGADIESNGDGTYEVIINSATDTSGKSASLTFTVVDVNDDDAVLATSSAATFSTGGITIASIVLGFNKQVFAPGEKAKVTLTAKDSDGFAVADAAYDVFSADGDAFDGLSASFATTGAPFSYAAEEHLGDGTGTSFVGGVATSSMFAPLIGGPITVSGTLGTGDVELKSTIQGTAIEGTATVSSAASETGAQITSLLKKINALTKLIAKIQKKLGIK
jgi:hypothetical protein